MSGVSKKTGSHAKQISRLGFDVGSGTLPAIDDRAKVVLNEYGQYVTSYPEGELDPRVDQASILSPLRIADENAVSKSLFAEIHGVKHREAIGYYTNLYAGYVAEGSFREEASSGGLATWILTELFKRGEIDGVIHVTPTSAGDEVLFRYGISRSEKEIRSRSRSRYYPVELAASLEEVRDTPGRYAVVGIPSVVAEVRLLALTEEVFRERIAYTIGLVCGHQKSTKYAESMAWQAGIRPGNLRGFDFRKKRPDGLAWEYQMEMTGIVDGQEVTIVRNQEELFGSDWALGFFKAKFSDYSDDALNETADVTVGDAWLKEYATDSKGTNVLIVRNRVIDDILEEGLSSGRIMLDSLEEDAILRSQRGLIHHARDELPYRLYRQGRRGEWYPKTRTAPSRRLRLFKRLVQNSRERLAAKSHSIYLEAVRRDDWTYFEKRMRPFVQWYRALYATRDWVGTIRSKLR